ncbi:MAG: ATP-binding protein [Fibrobacteres bacterium]|nr:ATP-binding protein [Fibrobacterota bacterium]
MTNSTDKIEAEVIAVFPNKVRISVDNLSTFKAAEESLRVGSYLKVSDNDNISLICIIESFSIDVKELPTGDSTRRYIIDAYPLGTLKGSKFERGGDDLAIPPKKVVPAEKSEIDHIYANSFQEKDRFCFGVLSKQRSIKVPVHGDKFFNKHVAIVGATGSGKSHSVSQILQTATSQKAGSYSGLNNSHIVIFDIHSEYKAAFPAANYLSAETLELPYWLLNDTEMEELFLESGDNNNYNQDSLLRTIITLCKQRKNKDEKKVYFDSPLKYDIKELLNCFQNLTRETKSADNDLKIRINGSEETFANEIDKLSRYCEAPIEFAQLKRSEINRGAYGDGSIDKFVRRIQAKVANSRLGFIFGDASANLSQEDVLRNILGYNAEKKSNVTIIDLSGIPFEVLSITVSLISRILFDFGYLSKRLLPSCETPMLLVYEEAHKYAPRSNLSKYKSSLTAIERIAKEGRKYGTSLLIASQRPSEISETIFSQCSNFLAMRLTNPDDQSYVKRLLPDTLGDLTAGISGLQSGEALLIGDATIMPCLIYVTPCSPEPSSSDIPYFEIWKKQWADVDFEKLIAEWKK